MNNSRLFRLSRIVIALTAASGMMVNTAYATDEAKAATQYTQQVNQNYAKSLPFSDRQDFDDAQRGFIAPLLDEGICAMLMANHIIAEKIINLISMRPRPKPLTQACGVSRRSTAFLACLKSPTACIRCAARISRTSPSLKVIRASSSLTRW